MVTEFRLKFAQAVFHRQVKVGETTADAKMVLDGRTFYVEMDMGTMPYKAMQRKWRCYANVTDFVLVVCLTEARKRGLIQRAELVKNIALFATLDELAEPHAEAWEDCFGQRVAIAMPNNLDE